MAGLDKIISQIKEESQEAAARTIAAARSEADQILAAARKEAERECADIDLSLIHISGSICFRQECDAHSQPLRLLQVRGCVCLYI